MERESDFLIINGVRFPPPDYGLDIVTTQAVSAGRNIKSLIDVNATVSAQITDGNGTSWVDINLGGDLAVTVK